MKHSDKYAYFEELAALDALGMLDAATRQELLDAAASDSKIEQMVHDYAETASLLAYASPEKAPPAHLRKQILQRLPARQANSKIIPFPSWIPYALAASLMLACLLQEWRIIRLQQSLSDTQQLANTQAEALTKLQLLVLESKDTDYASAKVAVAWDASLNRGTLAIKDMPPAPAGHAYQLWVLDSKSAAPISAGVITTSQPFWVKSVGSSTPGFAISLEPAGGSVAPRGPILFVASASQ